MNKLFASLVCGALSLVACTSEAPTSNEPPASAPAPRTTKDYVQLLQSNKEYLAAQCNAVMSDLLLMPLMINGELVTPTNPRQYTDGDRCCKDGTVTTTGFASTMTQCLSLEELAERIQENVEDAGCVGQVRIGLVSVESL